MKRSIFSTVDSYAPLALRLSLGVVIFAHGAQKLLGWFGGYGFSGTMGFFTDTMGLPWLVGFLVIVLEFFGAAALLLGAVTRIIALSYIFMALGIAFSSHIENGFFMNWYGNQAGEGYEFFILWIGMAFSLVISGGGSYSVDGRLKFK
ncbi:DoxX family protein [Poritiphilus flavus]|uniref:DoxX family membrane protein n=1 Tax=Poritiphilus flavus TaxID=2697053 RepID=A0A6L9EGP7_9FLAO|nr:DoxX family protein [Poritiphilus flavus]NAS13853.1 DoxX family membrane protein [Poritiphilus flavus]